MPVEQVVSDRDKAAVWQAYRDRHPTRVPVTLMTNPRVVVLNDEWNPGGVTFEQVMTDPAVHVRVALQHELYRRRVINRYCDAPTELPDVWPVHMMVYNTYDAAMLGAPLHHYADQVPDTQPYLTDANREAVFDVDIARPADNPFIKHWLGFWGEMARVCEGMRFEGRPVELKPWAVLGCDGPVTVAMNLRGADFMIDLVAEPDYADRLMRFIVDAAVQRRQFFKQYWGQRIGAGGNGLADDSCAMLGVDTYIERVLPMHRRWFDAIEGQGERGMHLCGDATRLYPAIHEQLDVRGFDTGFPVDFAWLRETLGEDVQIQGGPEVAALLQGTAESVHQRTVDILQSGIKRGGRFILREGNNLPPNVPEANLEAMYAACLEHGRYA